MSTYHGRRAPNMSQYIRDLNTVNPQETTAEDNFNMEDDLALFTNTQFFDWDSGQNTDFQAQPVKAGVKPGVTSDNVSTAAPVVEDMPNLDFITNDFTFPEFSSDNYANAPTEVNSLGGAQSFPSQPVPQIYANNQMPLPQQPPFAAQSTGEDRASESLSSANSVVNFDDVSRQAADEDKRRRNTAASARFRVKKKQREQALEKSAKEMSEKVNALENKVSQLETENKWLKNLLVEKNEGDDNITTMWKEFTKQAGDKLKASASSGSETR